MKISFHIHDAEDIASIARIIDALEAARYPLRHIDSEEDRQYHLNAAEKGAYAAHCLLTNFTLRQGELERHEIAKEEEANDSQQS